MTVVIHPGLYCAFTAQDMTCMTSLTKMLLLSFVSNLFLVFRLNSNWQDDIMFIGRQSMLLEI